MPEAQQYDWILAPEDSRVCMHMDLPAAGAAPKWGANVIATIGKDHLAILVAVAACIVHGRIGALPIRSGFGKVKNGAERRLLHCQIETSNTVLGRRVPYADILACWRLVG